jgi:hypothetical protein
MVDEKYQDWDEERQPWDKNPEETGHSYLAFLAYRDLGTSRSLRKAAEIFYEMPEECHPESTKLRQMKTWSSANGWRARTNAWDIHLERINETEDLQAVKDMRRRHAAIATVALAKAAERLRGLDADKLSARDAITFLDYAVKVERLARGEPDHVRSITGPDGAALDIGVTDEMLESRITALLAQEEAQEEADGELKTAGDAESDDS